MFRAWYVPFYNYGVIHGDPHLGNYTVRDDLDLNLLDFGCIRVFRPEFVKGVIDLYWALERDDRDLAVDAYRNWGFAKLDHATIDVLNEWAAFLYGPLLEDRPRPIEETHSSQQGRKVVERVHQKLREVGGVTPPREFVFMDRAAIGLGAVFMHLERAGELAPAVHGADRRLRRRAPARAADGGLGPPGPGPAVRMTLAWSPELYARHAGARLRPALDLLARVPLERARQRRRPRLRRRCPVPGPARAASRTRG